MHRLFPLTSLSIFLFFLSEACINLSQKQAPPPLENLSEVQIDSVLEQIDFTYETPMELDSSEYIVFPLSAYDPSNSKSRSDFLSVSKSSYSSAYNTGHWNLLFFHPGTQENHLLTKERILISDFQVNLPQAGPKLSRSIILKIRDTDFNQNGKIDLWDPDALYWVQQDGTGLERISPENEDLISYKVLSNRDEIIYQTQQVVFIGNKVQHDSYVWYYVNLSEGNTSTRILAPEEEKEIERLFFDQWVSPLKK